MSFLGGSGAAKLSQLTIDADKNWNGKGLSNLKALAAGMVAGDLIIKGPGGVLVRLPPGVANTVLTSAGPGSLPTWSPGGLYFNRYIPETVLIDVAQVKRDINFSNSLSVVLANPNLFQAHIDDPADLIRLLAPELDAGLNHATMVPDHTKQVNGAIGSDLSMLCGGFVEETAAGVQADKTTQARGGSAGDLNLCPMSDNALDKVYIGSNLPFRRMWIDYGVAGAGNWSNMTYYWNGVWTAVAAEDDATSSFQAAAGIRRINWTMPGDWVKNTIQGMDVYWVMIRTDNFVNRTTKPLGSQIWVCPVA